MSSALSLRHLSKTFFPHTMAPIPALRDVSLEVDAGDFVCIIGANGSGKSTLLRVVAGAHRADTGMVTLAGQDVTRWSEQRRAGQIAFVDQTPGARMAPALSIEQNMALALLRGGGRPLWQIAVRAKERDLFKQTIAPLGLGLENRLGAKMRELSGGQAQALTVASVIRLVTPQLLLLDEHCAALDPRMSKLVMETTSDLCRERGITTIMVTHDFNAAAQYGNRLIMMKEGAIAFDVQGPEKQKLDARNIFDLFMDQQWLTESTTEDNGAVRKNA